MDKIMKRILLLAAVALCAMAAGAAEAPDSLKRIVKGRVHHPEMDEKVIVGNDTVNLVLPEVPEASAD